MIGCILAHCQALFDRLSAVLAQHVRNISEYIHSKNFLKMSNLKTLLLLLKIQTFIIVCITLFFYI